ncbi:pseudouridine synthase [Pelomonas sp. SE-A7]|uniref:pseudouridine synthase n=1 Tax=Pelomonas sp. SE-A7 TaxID=3054953 RepID=UPI00259C80E0|nr:pseudouridine synthase [Pelomonas sp. SE-A7]MDM4766509.1 pseudouridine synthase [Pelomonas sp. SE-A7]
MSRPAKPELPLLHGVNASAVACPAGPWLLLLDFLAERLSLVAREDWLARMERGEVLDEQGQVLPAATPYRQGRRVFYYRLLDHEDPIPFEARVLFRDEQLLVVDKPHFLPVTPKGRYVQQTLLVRLQRELGIGTLSPIHRLDRETAGLTLFSLQPAQRDAYQRLFRERLVEKVYEAIAPAPPLDLTLPMNCRSRLVEREGEAFMQMQQLPGEPNAETRIAMIETLAGGLARYELRPRTGIKHQLRAQMNALGLPILGDRIYPVLQPVEDRPDYSRPLQLLARRIAFEDPLSGQPRSFESGMRLMAP